MEDSKMYLIKIDGNEAYNQLNILNRFKIKKEAYEIVQGQKPGFIKSIGLFFANKTYSEIAKDYITDGTINLNSTSDNYDMNYEHNEGTIDEEIINKQSDFKESIKINFQNEEKDFEEQTISNNPILDLSDILVESETEAVVDQDIQNLLDGIDQDIIIEQAMPFDELFYELGPTTETQNNEYGEREL